MIMYEFLIIAKTAESFEETTVCCGGGLESSLLWKEVNRYLGDKRFVSVKLYDITYGADDLIQHWVA